LTAGCKGDAWLRRHRDGRPPACDVDDKLRRVYVRDAVGVDDEVVVRREFFRHIVERFR